MFYSHEILTSQQYGVATVWLVSTIGLRSTNRKITKQAIQEVNVRKACETIIQPGAPIALRLQSSLLYGVSRVYSQQCKYVLTDAEKVHTHMKAYYGVAGGNAHTLDPEARKASRDQLIIQDDPGFDLDMNLPSFELDDLEILLDPNGLKSSQKTSSQLSPKERGSNSEDGNSVLVNFDLAQSSPGGGSTQLQSPFRIQETPQQKDNNEMMEIQADDDPFRPLGDWGLEIDADGNIAPVAEEPELPTLPRQTPAQEPVSSQQSGPNIPVSDNQGDIAMDLDDMPLPAAETAPPAQPDQAPGQVVAADQATMPVRRGRPPIEIKPDERTMLTRTESKRLTQNYLAIQERAHRNRLRQGPTPSEAKKYGYNVVFGNGIAGVGAPTGIPAFPRHPLAEFFAAENLQAIILGIQDGPMHGRRRTASEALELEEGEDENGRRVRRRLFSEAGEQQAQGSALQLSQRSNAIMGEEERELGREAGSALPDIPSDTAWNRGSSQVPGSSIKGSAATDRFRGHSRQPSPSPLHGRGITHLLSDNNIERFSDQQPVYGSDGNFAPMLHSGDNAFSDPDGSGGPGLHHGGNVNDNTSQLMRDALERDSNFLRLVQNVVKEKGDDAERDENGRSWVDFNDLFDGPDRTKHVAVQSFYHILVLATKDALKVRQECVNMEPFGPIQVGVKVAEEVV
ncbi:Rec8 like protein-domain-containing protein [Rhypophila decipiens]|uniref:Rec8 like protein-domain-containing protein n=1 Tax=Rhypophila decipiens TaxID=261697 RepID=A0AAN7BCT5_9PEZI|nr:Rec8 like protein-domain-containing protein [Rhypophila decipiens]